MNRRAFFPFSMLILAALACSLAPAPGSPVAGTPAGDTVATLVALQLTTAAQGTVPVPAAGSATPTLQQPAGTGSGLQVVYSRDGNIRLWDGAASRQLTASGQDSAPAFSDDGTVVAFRRNHELWAVNADGSNERALVSAGALAALPHNGDGPLEPRLFDFAPRSHDLYFNTLQVGEPFSVPLSDLAKVNTDSPGVQSLFSDEQGGSEFTFSPDGARVALARSDRINVANADGSGLKTVFTFPFVLMYSESSYTPQVAWLPDGSGFKTVIPAHDALSNPAELTRLMFVPADGGQAAQLAEFLAAPTFASRTYISPDGAKVLYAKPQGANLELHVIDASTADQMYFWHAANNFGVLGWAPDSLHVVYWIDDARRTWLGAPGAEGAPLSDVTFADRVTWLDANRFLFVNEGELRLRTLGQPSILIENGVGDGFDYSLRP